MALYEHPLFTINLTKVVAVNQDEDESAVTIRTDDQRKIEVATDSPEAAVEFLNEFAEQWERAVGPLVRHAKYAFLAAAIYSIQVQGEEVYINFRDHTVSFTCASPEEAVELLAELTQHWQEAINRTGVVSE